MWNYLYDTWMLASGVDVASAGTLALAVGYVLMAGLLGSWNWTGAAELEGLIKDPWLSCRQRVTVILLSLLSLAAVVWWPMKAGLLVCYLFGLGVGALATWSAFWLLRLVYGTFIGAENVPDAQEVVKDLRKAAGGAQKAAQQAALYARDRLYPDPENFQLSLADDDGSAERGLSVEKPS